jgi:hypothetical protein
MGIVQALLFQMYKKSLDVGSLLSARSVFKLYI